MHIPCTYNIDTFLNALITMRYDNSQWLPTCMRQMLGGTIVRSNM